MQFNIMDVIVLAIAGLSVFFGFKRGFLRTVTGFASVVLSLVIATTLHPYVAEYMQETSLYDMIYDSTAAVIQIPEEESGRLSDYGTYKLNLPREFTDDMQEQIDTAAETVADSVAKTVADAAINIISMLLVFLAARLILHLITLIAGVVHKLPIIGFGDSLLGALFGLLRGMLLIYILFVFVTFTASVTPDNELVQAVKQSEFAKVMYHHNVLLDFVYKN